MSIKQYLSLLALSLLLMGPAINLPLLPKITHAHFGVLAGLFAIGIAIANKQFRIKTLIMLLLPVAGLILVSAPVHYLQGIENMGRYWQYAYIIVFSSLVFIVALSCLHIAEKNYQWILIVPLTGFVLFLGLDILLGPDYTALEIKNDYSALHGNVNNQALALLLLSSVSSLLHRKFYPSKNAIFVLSLYAITLLYSCVVNARLVILFATLQLLVTCMLHFGWLNRYASKHRLGMITIAGIIIIGLAVLAMYPYLSSWMTLYINKVLANKSAGDFSFAERFYFTLFSIETLQHFSLSQWLFGLGFGQFNIINPFREGEAYFPAHNVYLEVLINNGIAFYIMYFVMFKVAGVRWSLLWPKLIILLPTFCSIVILSSAIYYAPFYAFLAVLIYTSRETEQ